MAGDNLKHIDTSTPEIRELVENIVGKSLSEAVNEGAFCPRCVAITLLEWASYAAVSSGATASDVLVRQRTVPPLPKTRPRHTPRKAAYRRPRH